MRSRPDTRWLLLCVVVALGCGTRYTRVPVYSDDLTKVVLRAELRDGKPVPRGFAQPATISNVRLAHILAQIDVRVSTGDEGQSERRPAIHTDLVYPLGERISEALAKADPDQEVVVEALRQERRLGLFTQLYVTSLVAWVDADERLYLALSRLDWQVPKGEEDERREPVVGRQVMAFRTLASEGIDPVGDQVVAVHWRDDRFRQPTNVTVGPRGRMTRRTILMQEEGPPDAPAPAAGELPSDPDTLRALAELEEERRAGAISEGEYQRRRRELLAPAAP